jgi:hypothetical protein
MSQRKDELALAYYQDKCKTLEEEVKEVSAANNQLDADNKTLKALLEERAESIKELDTKYTELVEKFKSVSKELSAYKANYAKIIKEARIVSNRYKAEMEALKATRRK